MNFEKYLIEILKDEFDQMMKYMYDLNSNELNELYHDENGVPFDSDGEFIKANADKIFCDDLMDAIYVFVSQASVLEQGDYTKLIAYLVTQYYINRYSDEKSKTVLSFLSSSDMKDIEDLFFNNDMFGSALIESFYRNASVPQSFYENKNKIKEDGNDSVLDRFYTIAFPAEVYTLNQKLREIVSKLYGYYLNRGYSKEEASEITWEYFIQGLDPLNQLDELGCTEEQKPFYRKYTLGLMIGDLYEDSANTLPSEIKTNDEMTSHGYSILLAVMGRIRIPVLESTRRNMLERFIHLQETPERFNENRRKTHEEKRERTLKKVNPTYLLDELTF